MPHAQSGNLTTALSVDYQYGRPTVLNTPNDDPGITGDTTLECTHYGPANAQVSSKLNGNLLSNHLQHYDNDGRMTGSTDAAGYSDEITFTAGLPTYARNRDGVCVNITYDVSGYGNITDIERPGQIHDHYTYEYNNGLPGRLTQVQVKDYNNNLLRTPLILTYNDQNRGLLQQVSVLRPGAISNADRISTTYQYDLPGTDGLGNVLQQSAPGPNGGSITTQYFYTNANRTTPCAGQPVATSVSDGTYAFNSYASYDDGYRVNSLLMPGMTTPLSVGYNAANQVQSVAYGTATLNIAKTFAGGPTAKVALKNTLGEQFGASTNMLYGAAGNLRQQSLDFPGAGDDEKLAFGYDGLQRVNSFADQNNTQQQTVQTSWEYDIVGRLTSINYTDGSIAEVKSYTAGGKPITVEISGNGQSSTIGYQYDPVLQQLTNIYYSGSSELNTTISHDDEGRVVGVTDGAHVETVTARDLMGNPLSMQQSYSDGPTNLPYAYSYNPHNGSLDGQSTPVGDFSYDADNFGRTVSVSGPQGSTDYSYEVGTGRLLQQTLYDSSTPRNAIAYTVYEYDTKGRMSRLAHYKPGTPDVLLAEYTTFSYDLAERRTGFSANLPALPEQYSGVYNFTYNAKGELTGENFTPTDQLYAPTTRTYGYGAAGNISNFNGTQRRYNAANQLTEEYVNGIWQQVADYDGQGNPTSYYGEELSYDQGDHLTAWGESMTAGYSNDGRRIWKEVDGQRIYFIYDDDTLIGEMDVYGNPTAVNTIGVTGLVSRQQGGSASNIYYLFDPLGNVLHRINNQGAIISSDIYDAWGNKEYTTDISGDPYGYKGQFGYYTDHETGLILCTHRYYDPETGRWLTKDPIGHEGGVNLYGYCGNDSVNGIDEKGLTPFKSGSYPDIIWRLMQSTPGTINSCALISSFDHLRKKDLEGAISCTIPGLPSFFERLPDYYP